MAHDGNEVTSKSSEGSPTREEDSLRRKKEVLGRLVATSV